MTQPIEKARQDAERFAPIAAEHEAEFDDLKRKEPSVLAACISKLKNQEETFQWAKNGALNDPEYLAHLDKMKVAEQKYLEAEKSFKTVIEFLKAVTSENYKQQAKLKAGIY